VALVPGTSGADHNNGGGFGAVEEVVARIRHRLGDEAAERFRRGLVTNSPRPVSDTDMAVLVGAALPVVRDLRAFGGATPNIAPEAHEDRGPGAVCAWIQDGSGPEGQGVYVWLASSEVEKIVSLAEQLQSWKLDELDPTGQCRQPWPTCPLHPGQHSLSPNDEPGVAVWVCPEALQVIAEIGSLGSLPPDSIPRFIPAPE
jgi:hypothetical protein